MVTGNRAIQAEGPEFVSQTVGIPAVGDERVWIISPDPLVEGTNVVIGANSAGFTRSGIASISGIDTTATCAD